MNKTIFLRPKPFKHRGGTASISPTGLRINTDGTTIKDRKSFLKLCSNHRMQHIDRPIRSWVSKDAGQAISDGQGWFKSFSRARKSAHKAKG